MKTYAYVRCKRACGIREPHAIIHMTTISTVSQTIHRYGGEGGVCAVMHSSNSGSDLPSITKTGSALPTQITALRQRTVHP
jgi:hypothetical protein